MNAKCLLSLLHLQKCARDQCFVPAFQTLLGKPQRLNSRRVQILKKNLKKIKKKKIILLILLTLLTH